MFPLKKSICKNLEISNNFPPGKKNLNPVLSILLLWRIYQSVIARPGFPQFELAH